jgi:hypothetical protein
LVTRATEWLGRIAARKVHPVTATENSG